MMNMPEMEEKVLRKEGVDMYYYVKGQAGNPLLVFIHPAFSDHTTYYRQVDAFAEKYRVLAVDMVAHGKSQVQNGDVALDAMAAFIGEMADSEGYEGFHVVGCSLGSLIAQDVARRFPARVQSVTVLGGYSIFGDSSQVQKAQSKEMLKWFFMVIFSMERFRRYVSKGSVHKPEEQEVFYASMKGFSRRSFMAMRGMQNVLLNEPKKDFYPLLILCGEHDLQLVKDFAEQWLKTEPECQFHIIKDAGHCANMDNAAEFNRILSGFIEQH